MLGRLEQALARLVEGTFGRFSRAQVQPLEIARRLVREMDDGQQPSVTCTYAPNLYDVYVSSGDHARLREYSSALESELSEYLVLHARRNGYTLLSRPVVNLHVDEDLGPGTFGIACRLDEAARAAIAAEAPGGSPQRTQVMQAVPAAAVRPATPALVLLTPSGPKPLTDTPLTIGRGRTNAVVLQDTAASREHAEIVPAAGGWVLRDRNSTNGTKLNGQPVGEQELHPGDAILIGSTTLRVEGAGP